MSGHITLDRDNLLLLVETLEKAANDGERDIPAAIRQTVRLGQQIVFDSLRAIADTSPNLYGPDGCPDIDALTAERDEARAQVAAVRARHEVAHEHGMELVCSCGVLLSNYGLTRTLHSLWAEHLGRAALDSGDAGLGGGA